jgi:hypothetical protein
MAGCLDKHCMSQHSLINLASILRKKEDTRFIRLWWDHVHPGNLWHGLLSDIDECQSNPCTNGDTCNNLENDYSCNCTQGWEGKDCSRGQFQCLTLSWLIICDSVALYLLGRQLLLLRLYLSWRVFWVWPLLCLVALPGDTQQIAEEPVKRQHWQTYQGSHVDRAACGVAWPGILSYLVGWPWQEFHSGQATLLRAGWSMKVCLRVGHRNLSLFPPCYI